MNLNATLALLATSPTAAPDLGELALLLARDEYPSLDVEGYLAELDALARDARRAVGQPAGLETRVTRLTRFLFHDLGFHGNARDYYDPRNSYLNDVLDRRTGIPITLSIVAMAIGGRIGLEVCGVGLPGHFVAKAVDGPEEVLFDPFHAGRVLSAEQCELLVLRATGQAFVPGTSGLRALPVAGIAVRMLANLRAIYLNRNDLGRGARVLERLRQLEPGNPAHPRDLGICLHGMGQNGRAIDHLRAYVRAHADAADAEAVRRILRAAETAVGRWN